VYGKKLAQHTKRPGEGPGGRRGRDEENGNWGLAEYSDKGKEHGLRLGDKRKQTGGLGGGPHQGILEKSKGRCRSKVQRPESGQGIRPERKKGVFFDVEPLAKGHRGGGGYFHHVMKVNFKKEKTAEKIKGG